MKRSMRMRVRCAVNAMYQDKRKQQPIGYAMEPMACVCWMQCTAAHSKTTLRYLIVLQKAVTDLTFASPMTSITLCKET